MFDIEECKKFAKENGIFFTGGPAFDAETGEPLGGEIYGFDYPDDWTPDQRRAMAQKIGDRFFPESAVMEQQDQPNDT